MGAVKGGGSLGDWWGWLCLWQQQTKDREDRLIAVVEQQTPRPTRFVDKSGGFHSSVLASTCILYGNYCQHLALLMAADIPHEECPPQRWQKDLRITPREKGEMDSRWKARLRQVASRLYPAERITGWNADAVLLATWLQRREEGRLGK